MATWNAIGGATGSISIVGSYVGTGIAPTAVVGVTTLGSFVIPANTINNGIIIEGNFFADGGGGTDFGKFIINVSGATANSEIYNLYTNTQPNFVNVSAVSDTMTKTEDNVVLFIGSEAAGDNSKGALGNMYAIGY